MYRTVLKCLEKKIPTPGKRFLENPRVLKSVLIYFILAKLTGLIAPVGYIGKEV
jgi:hypothetical protein